MSALRLGRRPRLAVSIVLMTMLAFVWFRPDDASAAITAVDATPETAVNQLPGDTTHSFAVDATRDSPVDLTDVKFVIVEGPNADLLNNGVFAADGTCDYTVISVDCSYTARDTDGVTAGVQAVAGTDIIRVFGDNNSDNSVSPTDPTDDIVKHWAGAPFTIVLTPDTDSAAVGTCNPFTATSQDAGGRPNPGVVIDITVSQSSGTAAFCDPDGGASNGSDGSAQAPADDNPAATVAHGEVTTPTSGAGVTFGISSTVTGTTTVTAWNEADNDDVPEGGEAADTSTKTWTAGGTDAVDSLDAQPETATPTVNTAHSITATLRNADGDTVRQVQVSADVTAGPNAAVSVSCDASDNDGVARCSYTGANAGQDTIVVWVQQSDSTTAGPDVTEPQDTITATWTQTSASPSPSGSTSPSPSPSASPGAASSISLTATPTTITAGNQPTLSGVVRDAQGNPVPNQSLTIYKKPYGSSTWSTQVGATTNSQGQYSVRVQPFKQTSYGANVNSNVRSPVRTIFVHTRMNLDSPTPAAGGKAKLVANPVTFRGSLLPAFVNVPVGLAYFEGGRFIVLTQTRTDSAGRYVITRSLPRGTHIFAVFTSARSGCLKGIKSIKLYVS